MVARTVRTTLVSAGSGGSGFKFYDGLFTYTFYPPRSPQSGWNSFNAGEFLWPQSRWSLLPLCLICGGLSVWLLLEAGRVTPRRS